MQTPTTKGVPTCFSRNLLGDGMAIRSFEIGPEKNIKHATYDNLPNLVIVAGPNGSGKSTLLFELYNRSLAFIEPDTIVRYSGPHRPWRKLTVRASSLSEFQYSYAEYQSMRELPNWGRFIPDGMNYLSGVTRAPEGTDETNTLLKPSFARIEYQRMRFVTTYVDQRMGQVSIVPPPDPYIPFRELIRQLLPHLEFAGVDASVENNIRVNFRRVDDNSNTAIDIDDLSSGEKAVISTFFPIFEAQMLGIFSSNADPIPGDRPVPTILLDEPEIHLHPSLQVTVMEYLRQLAMNDQAQLIIATHSPTILDAASNDEIFAVLPEVYAIGGNQFVKIASSEEKLETMRALTGSTHLLTRSRPIVIIEGEPTNVSDRSSDEWLIGQLMPEAAGWVMVSASGRHQVVETAIRLREAAADGLAGMPVFALIDADQSLGGDPDFVIKWPVAMIENLLLDPEAIWAVLEPHVDKIKFPDVASIEKALRKIAANLRDDEIRLRTKGSTAHVTGRLSSLDDSLLPDSIAAAKEQMVEDIESQLDIETIKAQAEEARVEVDQILAKQRELEAFRGKQILKLVFEDIAKPHFSRRTFIGSLVREVRTRERLMRLASLSACQIREYIPAELYQSLLVAHDSIPEGVEKEIARQALEEAMVLRERWETLRAGIARVPENTELPNRHELREKVVRVARSMRALGDSTGEQNLLAAAVQIGLG